MELFGNRLGAEFGAGSTPGEGGTLRERLGRSGAGRELISYCFRMGFGGFGWGGGSIGAPFGVFAG